MTSNLYKEYLKLCSLFPQSPRLLSNRFGYDHSMLNLTWAEMTSVISCANVDLFKIGFNMARSSSPYCGVITDPRLDKKQTFGVFLMMTPLSKPLDISSIDNVSVFRTRLKYVMLSNYRLYVSYPITALPVCSVYNETLVSGGSDSSSVLMFPNDPTSYIKQFQLSDSFQVSKFSYYEGKEAFTQYLYLRKEMYLNRIGTSISDDTSKNSLSTEEIYITEPDVVFVESLTNFTYAWKIVTTLFNAVTPIVVHIPGDGCGLLTSALELMYYNKSMSHITIYASDKYCSLMSVSNTFISPVLHPSSSYSGCGNHIGIYLYTFWFHVPYPDTMLLLNSLTTLVIMDHQSPVRYLSDKKYPLICDEMSPNCYVYSVGVQTDFPIIDNGRTYAKLSFPISPLLYQDSLNFKRYCLSDEYKNVIMLNINYRLIHPLPLNNSRPILLDSVPGRIRYLSFPNSIENAMGSSKASVYVRKRKIIFWSSLYLKFRSANRPYFVSSNTMMNYNVPMYIYTVPFSCDCSVYVSHKDDILCTLIHYKKRHSNYNPNVKFKMKRYDDNDPVTVSQLKSLKRNFPMAFLQSVPFGTLKMTGTETELLTQLGSLYSTFKYDQ